MGLFDYLVTMYESFLTLFPPELEWVVTLAIILVMIFGLIGLVRRNVLFILLLIPLAPLLWPPFMHLFGDLAAFFVYLLHTAHAPQS